MVFTGSDCRTVSRLPSLLGPCPASVQRRAGLPDLLRSLQARLPTGLPRDTDQTTTVVIVAAVFREGAMCQAPRHLPGLGAHYPETETRLREVKPLPKVAWLVGGRAEARTLVSCPRSLRSFLLCCPVSCPNALPPSGRLFSPSSFPFASSSASVFPCRSSLLSRPSSASVSNVHLAGSVLLSHSARSACPAAALPAAGPFWLATSCYRETLSSIFLTTRWPPLPPLNKLHGSNGWSTAEACAGRVGN